MHKVSKYSTCLFSILVAILFACEEPTKDTVSGLQGRIYANAGPGFVEFTSVGTIIVSDTNQVKVTEHQTDTLGIFRVILPAGTYVLDVKESPDKYQSGPYKVTRSTFVEAKAYYYDARML